MPSLPRVLPAEKQDARRWSTQSPRGSAVRLDDGEAYDGQVLWADTGAAAKLRASLSEEAALAKLGNRALPPPTQRSFAMPVTPQRPQPASVAPWESPERGALHRDSFTISGRLRRPRKAGEKRAARRRRELLQTVARNNESLRSPFVLPPTTVTLQNLQDGDWDVTSSYLPTEAALAATSRQAEDVGSLRLDLRRALPVLTTTEPTATAERAAAAAGDAAEPLELDGQQPADGDETPAEDSIAEALPADFDERAESLLAGGGFGPDAVRASGFSQLVRTLRKLLPAVDREGLSAKWRAVSDWCMRYYEDRDAATVERRLEWLLCLDKEGTAVPRRRRIAGACAALDQLLLLLARSQPSLWEAARELRRVILCGLFSGADPSAGAPVPALALPTISSPDRTERALYAARRSYETRPGYAHKVDVLQRQLGHVVEDMDMRAQQNDKLMSVMDRGIEFWQMQLLRRILGAWKSWLGQENRITYERKRAERLVSTTREVTEALANKKISAALAEQKEEYENKIIALEAMLREEKARVEILNAEVSELSEKIAEQEERYAILRVDMQEEIQKRDQDIGRYAALCRSVLDTYLQAPEWERYRQEQLCQFVQPEQGKKKRRRKSSVVLEDGSQSEDSVLLDWVNCALEIVRPLDDQYQVSSFLRGHTMLDPYVLIMNYMAPQLVNEAAVQRMLGCASDSGKGELFLAMAKRLGLHFSLDPLELVNPTSTPQHVLIVATLFHRFADSFLAQACGRPCFDPPASHSPDKPKQPQGPAEWSSAFARAFSLQQQWRKRAHQMMSVAVDVLLSKVQSKESKIISQQEREQLKLFVHGALDDPASLKRLDDLLPRPTDQREEELDLIRSILLEHYRALRRIYIFYSTSDSRGTDQELSTDELWKLLGDAKVTVGRERPQGLSRSALDDLFRKSNDGGGSRTDPTLNPTEYTRFLIRLADHRYPARGANAGKSLGERFRILLTKNIVPHCSYVDVEDLRDEIYSANVQEVLRAHKDLVLATFQAYAKSGVMLSKRDQRMSIGDFSEVVNQMNLVDSVLSHEAVRQIFLKLQDVEYDVAAGGEHTATYHEYLESLCCVALYKTPAPYLPMARRIARFFDVYFVPTFSDPRGQRKVQEEYHRIMKAKSRDLAGTFMQPKDSPAKKRGYFGETRPVTPEAPEAAAVLEDAGKVESVGEITSDRPMSVGTERSDEMHTPSPHGQPDYAEPAQ
eukprot:TRINITY_DN20676_c0_g1_i2.p1 TRINITY_DN20676_c0_g1~~TRINITY_DN20676_c0_g1_i2.p1  ORF type:complete len:1215 (+),score=406.30 TRINITY_DN20676_c0_g1_i2:79-3723(+)